MRTKALLCAAGLLAAGVATSMAQSNVYSLNIVGYANVTIQSGSHTYANPFDLDGINSATNVLTSLADGTVFSFWTGSAFNTWWYENIGDPGGNWWTDPSDSVHKTPPIIPPGTGFYINPGGVTTNTFVGNVLPGPGTTNSAAVTAGNHLISSRLPVSGSLSNTIFGLTATLPDGTIISKWTGSAFDTTWYENVGDPGGPWWTDPSDSVHKAPPNVNIGESFYVNPGGAFTWSQSLPSQ